MRWSGAPDFAAELKINIYFKPGFPDDADGGADNSPIWPDPHPIAHRDEISRSGIPHFDLLIHRETRVVCKTWNSHYFATENRH